MLKNGLEVAWYKYSASKITWTNQITTRWCHHALCDHADPTLVSANLLSSIFISRARKGCGVRTCTNEDSLGQQPEEDVMFTLASHCLHTQFIQRLCNHCLQGSSSPVKISQLTHTHVCVSLPGKPFIEGLVKLACISMCPTTFQSQSCTQPSAYICMLWILWQQMGKDVSILK